MLLITSTLNKNRTCTDLSAHQIFISLMNKALGLCLNHAHKVFRLQVYSLYAFIRELQDRLRHIQGFVTHAYRYPTSVLSLPISIVLLTQFGVDNIYKAVAFTELACFYIKSFLLCTQYLFGMISTSEIISLTMTIWTKNL